MPATPYQRLTRNATHLGSYTSLWLGADHLVIVRSTGYHETYARLQFADIKAFVLTESGRRAWFGWTWAIFSAASGWFVAATLLDRKQPIVSLIFLFLGLVALTWNHLLGPGCRAHVVTKVQTAEMPALVRMRKARAVLARLEPIINAAQADLVPLPAPPPVPRVDTAAAVAEPPAGSSSTASAP